MTLTYTQLQELKSRLLALRDELSQDAQVELEQTRAQPYEKLAGEVHDKGDEAMAELAAGMEAELADRRSVELHAVDAALQRIENGDYGTCMSCGDQIAFERLEAYPMARRCIVCKTKFEEEHAGFSVPTL